MLKQETKEAIADALAVALCSAANHWKNYHGHSHWRPIVESIPSDMRSGIRIKMHLSFRTFEPGQDTTGWIPLEDA